LNSLFDSEMKVYYVTQVLKQGINIKRCVQTTYSNLETRNYRIYCKSFYRRVGQNRNCHRLSCVL